MSSDGNGIAKIDNYTVFVPDTVVGDVAKIQILKTKTGYGYAKVKEVLISSEERIEPFCKTSKLCGGCSFCHVKYPAQLDYKKEFVQDAITRIGGFKNFEVSEIIGMDEPERYRNKMVFPFGKDKSGRVQYGFFRERSHDVIPVDDCLLGDEINIKILDVVKKHMEKYNIPAYDEVMHSGEVRRVFIRKSYHHDEIMVVISSNNRKIKEFEVLIENLKALDRRIVSIILNVNTKKNNLVLGNENITLYGKSTISDMLCGFKYEISPHSFFQVNPVQTEKLYKTAIDFANISKEDVVLDVYCGIGTISLYAAKYAKKVIGVEIVPQAIENAKKNAEVNGVKNADFYASDAADAVPELIENGLRPDVVILDPPRKGSDEETLSAIASAKPERIVYVSCNPSTLARDMKFLAKIGYNPDKAVAVDMFPHTSHVECCVLLCQKNN